MASDCWQLGPPTDDKRRKPWLLAGWSSYYDRWWPAGGLPQDRWWPAGESRPNSENPEDKQIIPESDTKKNIAPNPATASTNDTEKHHAIASSPFPTTSTHENHENCTTKANKVTKNDFAKHKETKPIAETTTNENEKHKETKPIVETSDIHEKHQPFISSQICEYIKKHSEQLNQKIDTIAADVHLLSCFSIPAFSENLADFSEKLNIMAKEVNYCSDTLENLDLKASERDSNLSKEECTQGPSVASGQPGATM